MHECKNIKCNDCYKDGLATVLEYNIVLPDEWEIKWVNLCHVFLCERCSQKYI